MTRAPQNQGLRVLLLSRYDRNGASSRLRFLQYLPLLEENGVDVVPMPLFDKEYLELRYKNDQRFILNLVSAYIRRFVLVLRSKKYDLVWIQGEIFPYLPPVAEYFLRLMGIGYVVDYDDAIFHKYDTSPNWFVRRLLGKKISTVMRLAHGVSVGNRYLEAKAKSSGAPLVEKIPTVVDYTRYSIASERNRADYKRSPVIGWIGSPTTTQYLEEIAPALYEVCQHTGASLHLVGANESIRDRFPKGFPLVILPWSEDSEAGMIAEFDIGIMPLVVTPWAKGKCGYKLIQYMASGVPVIATDTEANRVIVTAGNSGRLVPDGDIYDGWLSSIEEILGDPEQAASMGDSGRLIVVEQYSMQAQIPNVVSLLRRAANHKR